MTGGRAAPRVLLISMPMGALEWPALGLGLLQAELHRRHLTCDSRYLTFAFADIIGLAEYQWLCHEVPYAAFAGDWVFTESLYGSDPERDERFLSEVARARWRMSDTDVTRLRNIRSRVGVFLDHCVRDVEWEKYDVVGFTSTFQQNLASLALAQRIKRLRPELYVVFGGANWDGEMGPALHERFEFVDFALTGEADLSFPALVESLTGPPGKVADSVPGLVHRLTGRTSVTAGAAPIRDLDQLPVPDFGPYFADRDASANARGIESVLLVETGRGCWWGEKHHCTFCGLNGSTMAFRSKSAERVLDEITTLHQRSGVTTFSVVDNILDMRYFRTLLPHLEKLPLHFSWEVKANLTREQVRQLAAAHIETIQPGIESLSDNVLSLMDKGTTRLQNIQLLKWCKQYGVAPAWNLLFGFPGERTADYEEQLEVVKRIWHLDPPSGWGPVRLDRFSPYFDRPDVYGIVNIRPMAPYPFIYPFDDKILMRIASYFDFDYADGRDPWTYAQPLVDLVTAWQNDPHRGTMYAVERGADLLLVDDPGTGRRRRATLRGWKADVYRRCDRIHKPAALVPEGVDMEELVAFLDRCVAAGFMITQGGAYLSLAVEQNGIHTTNTAARTRIDDRATPTTR
ncbi:RiPP maturation radical SAM C-methyltransferase [Kibdelosporangium lantanae]